MAEGGWTKPLAWAAMLFAVVAVRGMLAQSPPGALTGKLTDLHSRPVEGATIILRNRATGAEVSASTTRGGSYRFRDLTPGEYSLEALIPEVGRGSVDGIEVQAGHEAHVQAALEFTLPSHEVGPAVAEQRTPAKQKDVAVAPVAVPHALVHEGQEKPDTTLTVLRSTLQFTLLAALPLRANGARADLSSRPELALGAGSSGAASLNPIGAPLGGSCLAEFASTVARAALRVTPKMAKSTIELARSVTDGVALAPAIPAAQLQALPLPERNWQAFVLDNPPQRNNESGDHFSSSIGEAGSATVDGASATFAFGNAIRARGQSAALLGREVSEAAIREVQAMPVLAEGPDANSGSRIHLETEHGSSALRGQAFLFGRANLLNAQNPFTQWVLETAPATATTIPVFTPEPYSTGDRETKWGIGVGGPLLHQRSRFWFAAIDGLNRNDPGVSTVKHPDDFFVQPSNDQMQVLSARLGLNSTNPVAAGLAPYSSMLETLHELLGPAVRTSAQWTGFGRLDWAAGERNRLTLEGSGALWNSPGGGLTRASEPYGTHSYGSSRANNEWLLGRWEAYLTSNLLAVTQGSIGRQSLTQPSEKPSAWEQTLNVNDWGRLPQMVVDSRYGFTIGNLSRFGPGEYPDEHLYEGQEQVDWVRGSLLVKAGLNFEHNNDATTFLRNQTGTYSYSSAENFASDALAFAAFGLNGQLNPMDQHNCDATGKVWRDSAGALHGLGNLPCYSWYSQTLGPTNWWLSTNDWASYLTSQWQPKRSLVASLAMRWELEQTPPPIALLNNPDLPLTERMPSLGSHWGPRFGLAWGRGESHWPVMRLGYGMYFGRTPNATFETVLTQTGSLKGDLNFFLRPTDNLNAGGAPPFPYVLAGEPGTIIKPGAVEFAPGFHNGEIDQGIVSVEETLPAHVHLDASALTSLGRRLPIAEDANIDPAVNPQTITYAVVDGNGSGPIKTPQITVPFFASWPSLTGLAGRLNPNYQQVAEIFSRANSTYEAMMLRVTRSARSGLTLHARYTYAHAMDWNPDESASVTGPSVFDPTGFAQEYGTSNLDVRHSVATTVIWEPRWKLREARGWLGNGWMLSAVGSFRSGLPYTMRTAGSLAKEFDATGAAIVALAPGMNGYGGDDRVYSVGRNTYRYPATWKADLRLGKRFSLGSMRQLELLAESFNLFNHQNVTELETVGYSIESGNVNGSFPTLNFLTGLKTGQTEFGQPLNVNATDFYRPRQIQFGVRFRF
jgi:hypothetical protein